MLTFNIEIEAEVIVISYKYDNNRELVIFV